MSCLTGTTPWSVGHWDVLNVSLPWLLAISFLKRRYGTRLSLTRSLVDQILTVAWPEYDKDSEDEIGFKMSVSFGHEVSRERI